MTTPVRPSNEARDRRVIKTERVLARTAHDSAGTRSTTKAGVPSDADYTVPPPLGFTVVNTLTAVSYTRTAVGVWTALQNVVPAAFTPVYNQYTANVSCPATTEGTANTIITSSSAAYTAIPYWIDFFSPAGIPGTSTSSSLFFVLLEDTTVIAGIWGQVTNTVGADGVPVHLSFRRTPTAANHTYTVKAFSSVSTGTVAGGAGGTGAYAPGFIAIRSAAV